VGYKPSISIAAAGNGPAPLPSRVTVRPLLCVRYGLIKEARGVKSYRSFRYQLNALVGYNDTQLEGS